MRQCLAIIMFTMKFDIHEHGIAETMQANYPNIRVDILEEAVVPFPAGFTGVNDYNYACSHCNHYQEVWGTHSVSVISHSKCSVDEEVELTMSGSTPRVKGAAQVREMVGPVY